MPLYLNGVRGVCPCDTSSHKSVRKFQVSGCIRWATSTFCDDLEAVLAFLFPERFQVELDQSWKDIDETTKTYLLCDEDGARLDKRLPVEFATRTRAIKHHASTLSFPMIER
jgi:hypothetical protein